MYINLTLLIISFVCILLLKGCLTSAEKKLTPSVYDEKGRLMSPDKFNICFNERKAPIDPFVQYEELPRMRYLAFDQETTELNKGEIEQLVNDDERQALLDHSLELEKTAGE